VSHWSALKEKSCGYWQLKSLLIIYKLFGRGALKISLYPVVFVFHIVSKQTREFSAQYLNRIYKYGNLPKVTYFSTFKHVFSFADALVDKVIAWSGNIMMSAISIQTPEHYEDLINNLNNKQGVFLICSHLGNIEVFRAIGNMDADSRLKTTLRMNTLVQIAHTEHFNRLLKQLHPGVTNNLVSATDIGIDTALLLKDKINDGEIVITAGDRTAAKNQEKTISMQFLGDDAPFPSGSFIMASLMDCPVYFTFLLKSGGAYRLYIYKSAINFAGPRKERKIKIEQMIMEYRDYLQTLTLKYPYQWYNFFDFWRN
jgi:predicted LPLAT superfamily acyltransferase